MSKQLKYLPLVDEIGKNLPVRYGIPSPTVRSPQPEKYALWMYMTSCDYHHRDGNKYRVAAMRSLTMTTGALARQLKTATAATAAFKRVAQAQAKALDLGYTSSSTEQESDSAMSPLPPSPLSEPRATAAHDPTAGSTDGGEVKSAPPPPLTIPPSPPASAHNGAAAATATAAGTGGENTVSANYTRKGRVEKPTPGLVVWAKRGAELWPSLIRQKIGYDTWTVVHLGPVVSNTRGSSSPTEPAFSVEEVMSSSLLQFPGGVPIMALKKLKRPPKSTEKEAKRAHVRDELSLPANKERQVLQLAIDHAVHLCVVYSWGNDTNMVNVLDGVSLDGLGLTAKGAQNGRKRLRKLMARQDRWAVTPDTWRSWERLRLIVNLGDTSVGSVCQNLRYVYQEVENWINGSPKRSTQPTKTLTWRPQQHRKELASGGGGAIEGAAVVCATRPAAATSLADSMGHVSTKMLLPRSPPCARSSSTKKDGGRARKSNGANANARSNRDGPQDGSGATVVKPNGCAKFNNRNGDAKRGKSVAAPQQGDGGGRRSCVSTGNARRKIQGRMGGHADASAGAGKKKNMGPATERAATTPATTKVTLTERERRVPSESEDREAKKHVNSAKPKLTMKTATSCRKRRQLEYERDEENGRQPRIASSTLKATTSGRKRRICESDDEQEHAVHATTVNKIVRKGSDKKSVCNRGNVQGWQRRDGTTTIPTAS
ncbi:unnamed protein product [Ectocarpus sp. 12 AP-2014]